MVYGKRKFRRFVKKPKKTFRPTKMVKTLSPYRDNDIKCFKRTCITVETLMDADTFGSIVFELNDLNSYTEFSNLFEEYRITGVKLTFIWNKNSAQNDIGAITPGDSSFIPNLYLVYDPNDVSTPASIVSLLERGDVKIRRLDRPCKMFVRPKVAASVYESGVTTAYADASKLWLSTASQAVDYYGVKWAVDASTAGIGGIGADPIGKLTIIKTFYLQCRGTK